MPIVHKYSAFEYRVYRVISCSRPRDRAPPRAAARASSSAICVRVLFSLSLTLHQHQTIANLSTLAHATHGQPHMQENEIENGEAASSSCPGFHVPG